MDVHRDEADKCIDIALNAYYNLNFQRAEKFLRIAENLFPTQRAKDLLTQIHAAQEKTSTNNESTTRRRHKTNPNNENDETTSTSVEVEYTKEQIEMCIRIKKCKDYYEVLNVTKEATDTEIKKSYKRLALQLHPDKNRAPGAVEAFKTLGNAAGVLTDSEKRKNYDLLGDKSKKTFNRHQYQTNHDYEHMYRDSSFESDFTAEELFNMFFGNGFPQQRPNHTSRRYQNRYEPYRHYQHQQPQQQQPSLAFGIILVLILISMLSSFFTSDSIYSLAQSPKYPVLRKTIHLNVPYYVKDRFESEYQGSLARLENAVEEEYIIVMKQACYRERSYREIMMARARSFGNEQQLEQAKALKVTSCENLARIGLTKFMPN